MTVREKLLRWMKENGAGQDAVASTAGVGQSAVGYFCSGKTRLPTYPFLIGVARTMDCDLRWLLDETTDWPIVRAGEPLAEAMPAEDQKILALAHDLNAIFGKGEAIRRLMGQAAAQTSTERVEPERPIAVPLGSRGGNRKSK